MSEPEKPNVIAMLGPETAFINELIGVVHRHSPWLSAYQQVGAIIDLLAYVRELPLEDKDDG